jgi:hypothetical protein
MAYADRQTDGSGLLNIREGCARTDAEARAAAPSPCGAFVELRLGDGRSETLWRPEHAHNDAAPGCARVELSRLPIAGEHGPFGYDPETRAPIPHAERTAAAKDKNAALASLRTKLTALGLTSAEINLLLET